MLEKQSALSMQLLFYYVDQQSHHAKKNKPPYMNPSLQFFKNNVFILKF